MNSSGSSTSNDRVSRDCWRVSSSVEFGESLSLQNKKERASAGSVHRREGKQRDVERSRREEETHLVLVVVSFSLLESDLLGGDVLLELIVV